MQDHIWMIVVVVVYSLIMLLLLGMLIRQRRRERAARLRDRILSFVAFDPLLTQIESLPFRVTQYQGQTTGRITEFQADRVESEMMYDRRIIDNEPDEPIWLDRVH